MVNAYEAFALAQQRAGERQVDIPGLTATNQRLRRQGHIQPEQERGPSLINRVFDILSRPNYAIAGAVGNALDDDPSTGILGGLQQGITGRDKRGFGDVIEQEGVTGTDFGSRLARGVGGFALDVLTDPTTYLSFGTAGAIRGAGRAVGRSAVETAAGRAAMKAVGGEAGQELTERALRETADEFAQRAQPLFERTGQYNFKQGSEGDMLLEEIERLSPQAREVFASVREKLGLEEFKTAAQRGADEATLNAYPTFEVKFAGVPFLRSERVGKAIGRSIETLDRTTNGPIGLINRLFRNNALLPDGSNSMKLITESRAAAYTSDLMTRYAKRFQGLRGGKGLSNDELEAVSILREKRVRDHHDPAIQEAINIAEEFFDNIAHIEVTAGVLDPTELIDNYIPHMFKGTPPGSSSIRGGRRVGDYIRPGYTNDRKVGSIIEGTQEGYKMIKRVDHLMGHRLAKHFQVMAQKDFMDQIIDQFGVELPKRSEWLRSQGFDDLYIQDQLKKAGGRDVLLNDEVETFIRTHGGEEQGLKVFKPANGDPIVVPSEIHRALSRHTKIINSESETARVLAMYDKIQTYWKAAATVYNPGHHIRNLGGDGYMNMMDGVVNPRVYAISAIAMTPTSMRRNLPEAVFKAAGLRQAPNGSHYLNIGGRRQTLEQLMAMYYDQGLKSGFFRAELADVGGGIARNLPMRINQKVRGISSGREEYMRFAHFVDAARKEAKSARRRVGGGRLSNQSLNTVYQNAGARVRTWNFDYNDLTPFERDVLRRIVPFYTFLRKNIPAQLEALFMRPGRVSTVSKAQRAIEELLGTAGESETDIRNNIPEWLASPDYVQLTSMSGESNPVSSVLDKLPDWLYNSEAGGGGATYLGIETPLNEFLGRLQFLAPQNPSEDLSATVQQGAREVANMSNPFIKALFEQATGRSTFTGAEVQPNLEYAASFIPAGRVGYGLANPEARSDNPGSAIFNWLTGAGLQQATPSRQAGELRRQEDVLRTILERLGI